MAQASFEEEKSKIERAAELLDQAHHSLVRRLRSDNDAAFVLDALFESIEDQIEMSLDHVVEIERRKAVEE